MASELERAFHTFALHPNCLSWRFYRAHLASYSVDRRIDSLKASNEWPPRVDIRARWPEFSGLLDVLDDPNGYSLTLNDHRITLVRLAPLLAR